MLVVEEKALNTFQKYWTFVTQHHLVLIWDLKTWTLQQIYMRNNGLSKSFFPIKVFFFVDIACVYKSLSIQRVASHYLLLGCSTKRVLHLVLFPRLKNEIYYLFIFKIWKKLLHTQNSKSSDGSLWLQINFTEECSPSVVLVTMNWVEFLILHWTFHIWYC